MPPDPDRVVRLPEAVANQIAAGEVVERPASVVKELVENAVDAGATRVEIDVEQGGQRRIRVTDDGEGMSPRDAVACLERHATSKIRAADDLIRVRTLGFRGEALPSIASVSRFRLTTRRPDDEAGTRVVVEGTRAPQVEGCGAAPGTQVEVDDLFFNVPARKKFMRRPATEMGHITEAVTRLALATPGVAFRLRGGDRVVLDAPADDGRDPTGRIGRVLGRHAAERLLAIPPDDRPHAIEVAGFISEPGFTERTSRSLYVFLNGRFIRDRGVQHAVLEPYRTLIERGRFPVCVLHLTVDPVIFDVNVHPQKTEVRFRSPQDVHRGVFGAISRALDAGLDRPAPVSPGRWAQAVTSTGERDAGPRSPTSAEAERSETADFRPGSAPRPDRDRDRGSYAARAASFRAQAPWPAAEPSVRPPSRPSDAAGERIAMFVPREAPTDPEAETAASPAPRLDGPAASRSLGVAFGRYLVAERGDRLALVDLRAVVERRRYEALLEQARRGEAGAGQRLLVPRVVELSPAAAERARDLATELQTLGFEVEDFGGASVAVVARPADVDDRDVEALLVDLLAGEGEGGPDLAARRRERWARRAARAGARVPVSPEARDELVAALERDGRLRRSLDGRPTVVELSTTALERLFEDRR